MSRVKLKIYMRLVAFWLVLTSANVVSAVCTSASNYQGRIQWSEPASILSPNQAWRVDVNPILTSDENETPVSIYGCLKGNSLPLFALQRSAEVYWGPSSENLLVINQPTSGNFELYFFDLNQLSKSGKMRDRNRLDDLVKRFVQMKLGASRKIVFYLPAFVSWNNRTLTLAVGGVTTSGGDGPTDPYCYGIVLNSDTLRAQNILSAQELKSKFNNVECRIFP